MAADELEVIVDVVSVAWIVFGVDDFEVDGGTDP